MQPSAQGIASLFMGNPGALAARVDQDRKQSPMGIPDDLRQLMALNIVTNETDAAKRQQALNELQQMAPNGQPPTVAQSLRQQAAQKLQARMVQEQQKQQAMQQMMGGLPAAGIPQGVPQPERQPQGIDEAPVEFGMASGGIVSFNGTTGSTVPRYESLNERAERQLREKGSIYDPYFGFPEEERRRMKEEADLREAQERARGFSELAAGNVQAIVGQAQARLNDLQQNQDAYIKRYGAKQYQQALDRANAAVSAAQARGADITARQAQRGEEGIKAALPPPAPTPATASPDSRVINREMINRADAALFAAPPKPPAPSPRPPARDLKQAAETAVTQPAAPAPAAPSAPEFQDPRLTPQGLSNMSSAAELQETDRYGRLVGAPSTAALDKLMAEYERQKAATESPTGMAGLMEFMSQIAASSRPGRSSLQAGAAGVAGTQALERERAAQRAALIEKQIGLEQQKLNAARDYAKEVFGVGKAAYDKEYERNFNMFKAQGEDVRAAERRAHEMTLEDLRYRRQIEQEERRVKNELKLRGTPTAEMDRQDKLIKMYMKEQEDKGNKVTYLEAVQAIGALGQTERTATPTDRLRAAQSLLEDAETDAERAMAKAEIARIMGASQTQRSTAPPAVGTIMDGYRFKGGNPADSKNWEKV